MKFDIPSTLAKNIENKFQYAVLQGNTGNSIVRHLWTEQPRLDEVEYHPDNNKIHKRLNKLIFVEGKIKVTYQWEDDEGITQDDVNQWKSLMESNNPEHTLSVCTETDNSISYEIEYPNVLNDWTPISISWELKCNRASIEVMQDNTNIFCILNNSVDVKLKSIDIPAGETKELNQACYVYFSQNCEITKEDSKVIHTIPKQSLKKLKNEKRIIKNIADTTATLVMIYE